MNEFDKLVDKAIEEAVVPPRGTRGKKVYTVSTKRGPLDSKTDKGIANIVKSGDLEDVPYNLQATGPLEYSYSTKMPEPTQSIITTDVLSSVLESSCRWFEKDDIKDAWGEFNEKAKTKIIDISIPTDADKDMIWNLFYDLMLSKIKPLRTADEETYNKLKSMSGKGLGKEILRPANRRLWAMVESRKSWAKETKSKLRKLKNNVINHVFPTLTEDIDHPDSLTNYSKALAEAYANANYDFIITTGVEEEVNGQVVEKEEKISVPVNLIKNYDMFRILAPGLEVNSKNSLLYQINISDENILAPITSTLNDLEDNGTIKNIGWKFDRNELRSSLDWMSGASKVFEDQFVNLIHKLPSFGNTREEAQRIYDLLIYGRKLPKIKEKTEKTKSLASVKIESEPKEKFPEESPTLYPTISRRGKRVSPEALTAKFSVEGIGKNIRGDVRNILKSIINIVDTYRESYNDEYLGKGRKAAAGLLEKDPSREREGLGVVIGMDKTLKKIKTNLDQSDEVDLSNVSLGELKMALLDDADDQFAPQMVISLLGEANRIKEELIDPWISSSDFSTESDEDKESDDAKHMRNASLPEEYSGHFNIGIDPIKAAYRSLPSLQEKKKKKGKDSYDVNKGAVLTVPAPGVLDSDTGALTATIISNPAHAANFALNADGSFTYRHDGSETTSDSFTYKVNGGTEDGDTIIVDLAIISESPKRIWELESEREKDYNLKKRKILSTPMDPFERRKLIRQLDAEEKEIGTEEEQLEKRADNLAKLFVDLVKFETNNPSKTEITNELRATIVFEMTKLTRGSNKPIFSRMGRKVAAMEMNSEEKESLLYGIIDLITEVNGEINPDIASDLVFAAIANNGWEALDLLAGVREMSGDMRSVESLIRAAASTGEIDTISWAIEFMKELSNTGRLNIPIVSLSKLMIKPAPAKENKYRAMKKFGISPLSQLATAFPQEATNIEQIKKWYSDNLPDIIKTYGKDAMISATKLARKTEQKNPEVTYSSGVIARTAIKNSKIEGEDEDGNVLGFEILNPLGLHKDSPRFKIIERDLINIPIQDKQISVFDQFQKFEELKDMPETWQADLSLNASAMVNQLAQKLSKLIKELAGNLLTLSKKSKGKKSADELIDNLPKLVRSQLKDFGMDEKTRGTIITPMTIVPVSKVARDKTNVITKDLIRVYNNLKRWEAKCAEKLEPSDEKIQKDSSTLVAGVESRQEKSAAKHPESYPYIFGIVGDSIVLRDRTKESSPTIIELPGIDIDELKKSFQRHMSFMEGRNKSVAKIPFKSKDGIGYCLTPSEMSYAISGLKPSATTSNIERFGSIVGMVIDNMETGDKDTKTKAKALRDSIIIPLDKLNAVNSEINAPTPEINVPSQIRMRVSSKGKASAEKTEERIKKLKKEIEALELNLKSDRDMSAKEKQKRLSVINDKRGKLQAAKLTIDSIDKSNMQQDISEKSEIENLIKAMPDKEREIRAYVNKNVSFKDIVELVKPA